MPHCALRQSPIVGDWLTAGLEATRGDCRLGVSATAALRAQSYAVENHRSGDRGSYASHVAATAHERRRMLQCAGDRQELLALSSSLLEDRRDLNQEVTRLTEALKGAQQGYLRLSRENSDVLGELLQVLGALQTLRQERAALHQENAFLHQKQETLRQEHEALHQEHAALLHKHAALLQEQKALQVAHETLQTEYAGLAKDQQDLEAAHGSLKEGYQAVRHELHSLQQTHTSLRQDHLRLQDERKSLQGDMAKMAGTKQQLVTAVEAMRKEWHRTEEMKKRQVESLLSLAAENKDRAMKEAEEKYRMLLEERNSIKEELSQVKKGYEQVHEEKTGLLMDMTKMAETNQQVVKAVKAMKEEWHRTEEKRRRVRKQFVESLLSKAAEEKEKVTMEAEERYRMLLNERNSMKEELSLLQKTYKHAQEEKSEIRQYHERAVYVAALTIDRLQQELKENCGGNPGDREAFTGSRKRLPAA
ncbi:golgin subfamily A member 6-like protein 4 [Scylla paramamosain]|uniref:golgin subfamily A member 6-like protein 4 n=1 Tax=Scylla paramamosain TaxID=85552 RepID=UPI003082FB04